MKRKITAFMLALLVLLSAFPVMAAGSAAGTSLIRYCVLVLDVSGSMSGTPLKVQKEAAAKFCEDALSADGTTYISVVRFSGSASKVCDFTDDPETLQKGISRLSTGSSTDICSALVMADQLLQAVDPPPDARVVRNIVLCSDGIPVSGPVRTDGPFAAGEGGSSSSYKYANAVCETAEPLKPLYNIYTLGFFHSLSGAERSLGSKLLSLVQNAGYHEVTDPDILEFVFGEIMDSITNARRHDAYTEELLWYYANAFSGDIQAARMPSPGDPAYRNILTTADTIGNLAAHAAQRPAASGYRAAADAEAALQLAPGAFGEEASGADLLLADMLTSPAFRSLTEAAAASQYMNSVCTFLHEILDYSDENLAQLAAGAGYPQAAAQADWRSFALNFDTLNICNDTGEFRLYFDQCVPYLDTYISSDIQQIVLDRLAAAGSLDSSVADLLRAKLENGDFSGAAQLIRYGASCGTWQAAQGALQDTIRTLSIEAAAENAALAAAAGTLASRLAAGAADLQEAADALYPLGLSSVGEAAARLVTTFLASVYPAAGTAGTARQGMGADESFLPEVSRRITQTAFRTSLVQDLYFLHNSAVRTAGTLGEAMRSAPAAGRSRSACSFELACAVWKYASGTLCDLANQYAGEQLQLYLPLLQEDDPPQAVLEESTWCTAAGLLARTEKKRLPYVDFHVPVNAPAEPVSRSSRLQIICIACPVDVTVHDASGNPAASLTGGSMETAEGYETYFDVLPTAPGADDYMKLLMVPDNWSVSFTGTDAGRMHVLKAGVSGGTLTPAAAQTTAVFPGTQGRIPKGAAGGPLIVIDDPGEKGFVITFDPGHGSCERSEDYTDASGRLSSLPEAVRATYTFGGWYLPDGTQATKDTVYTEDTRLTARWTAGISIPGLSAGPLAVPEIPAVDGYQGGILNGRTYYAKVSGQTVLFYRKNSGGRLARVSAPYTEDRDGRRFWPVNCGGEVLFPRIENGTLTAYCLFAGGWSLPRLLIRNTPSSEGTGSRQAFILNGRDYTARTSGASILFYRTGSGGKTARVSAPYAEDSEGRRWYPVNYGGMVLCPELEGGRFVSFAAPSGEEILPAAGAF